MVLVVWNGIIYAKLRSESDAHIKCLINGRF